MDSFLKLMEVAEKVLNFSLIHFGGIQLTIGSLVYFLLQIVLLFFLAGKLKIFLSDRLLLHTKLDIGIRQAIGTISRYLILFFGLLVILQTGGINLTTFNVVAGAVSVGIGFGLQNIASNFISGLIILFERPIKIGDRIQIGEVVGDVIAIGARSTTVITNDRTAIIIPNSKFVTENVINLQYDERMRLLVPISLAYGVDAHEIESVLLTIAQEHDQVLKDPAPVVRLKEFADSSINFELSVWCTIDTFRKQLLKSQLNFAIYDKLNKLNIEIPFPQRDLHIRSGVIEIKQHNQP